MSSFLDSEAVEKLGAMLDSSTEGTPEPVIEAAAPVEVESQSEVEEESLPSPEPVVGDTPEEVVHAESIPTETVEVAPESDSGQESSGTHRVPYNRFKKVIDARNQYQSENDVLKSRLEAMERQITDLASKPPSPSSAAEELNEDSDPWLDEAYDPEDNQGEAPDWQRKYSSLESRVKSWEFEQAKSRVQEVVSDAEVKYPTVPKQALLEWIIKNPSQPANLQSEVLAVAERFSTWIAQVEEAGIARYVQEGSQTKAGGKAAPRPAKSGGQSQRVSISPKGDKPRTLKETKAALIEFLEHTNPFS